MLIDAVSPPAIHAPVRPCADDKAVKLHISATTLANSPDCQWQIIFLGLEGATRAENALLWDAPEEVFSGQYNLFVIEHATRKVIARTSLTSSAMAHWQKDGGLLVINDFAGSDFARPLVIELKSPPNQVPVDLSKLIYSDVLKRLKKTDDQVYHYYVHYIANLGDRIHVSVQPDYTLDGTAGPGWGRCFIYTFDKTNLFSFRFEREVPWKHHDLKCPHHPDEK